MSFLKPAPGSNRIGHLASKATRRTAKRREQTSARAERYRQARAMRETIWTRDHGRCRVCNVGVTRDGHPATAMQMHHIVYRSAGGSDLPENLIALCWRCHEAEHAHTLQITGTAEQLTIIRRTTLGRIISEERR